MRLPPGRLAPQIRDFTQSRAFRAAAAREEFYSVCLIGWDGPRPAVFGDNLGIWPVRVATAKKDGAAHKHDDLATPHARVVVLEAIYVGSEAHAKRLKDALDEMLLGQQEEHENRSLRHRWRDVRQCFETPDERAIWWGELVLEAVRLCKRAARAFETFDRAERDRRSRARARRI